MNQYLDVPEYEWSRLDGTLYYISQSSMTSYTFARRFCQAQGGDLAQPKTEEINVRTHRDINKFYSKYGTYK